MPLQKLQFRPGVNREGTTLANEGGWFECNKVRFRSGYPEKIGGWAAISYTTFQGVCRSLWNWATVKGYNLLGVGTHLKFYIESGGAYNDITPSGLEAGLPIAIGGTGWGTGPWSPYLTTTLTNPFTASGSGVSVLTVTQASHGLSTGDYVYFTSIASDPCGIPKAVLKKGFQITKVNANSYTISTVIGTLTYLTTSSAASGGSVIVEYPDPTVTASYNRGWGVGFASNDFILQLRLWSQANFGDYLIFNPRGGGMYVWQAGVGIQPNFAQPGVLISSTSTTPSGWSSVVAQASCPNLVNQVMVSDGSRIVIAFGCNDPSGTLFPTLTTSLDPMLIRWSAQETYLTWDPQITNQAGFYRLSRGSTIVSAIQTRQEILVCTDSALYSMQYTGAPFIWSFTLLADNISIASPNAMATVNGVTYWMGVDKFYVYSGRVETLPSSLRQYVFDDINFSQNAQIFAGTNEGYNEVWWFYCSANSNVVDRYVIFNHLDRVWYYGTLNRTAWSDSPLRPYPEAAGMSGAYFNASITNNILTVTNVTYGTITTGTTIFSDNVPSGVVIQSNITGSGGAGTYSISNPNSLAGTLTVPNQLMSAVTTDTGLIVDHEADVNDGMSNPPSPISSYVQSSDFDIGDGHNYGFVWQIIPDITFDGSSTPGLTEENPKVTFTVRPRQNPGSAYGVSDTPTVQSTQSYRYQQVYNVQEFTEIVYTRVRGRQMAFKISSDTLGTQWQLGTPRINVRPDGRR
jgi:hypothetical protein